MDIMESSNKSVSIGENKYCLIEPFLCRGSTVLFRTVATIFASILIFLVLLFNLPLLYTILHLIKNKLKPFHIIILNIVVSDLLIGVIYLPVLIVVLQRGEATECDGVCTALVSIEKGSIAASV